MRTAGRRSRLLDEKVPSSFVQLEALCAQMTDECRANGEEPLLTVDELWTRANNEHMLQRRASGVGGSHAKRDEERLFRDRVQFRAALNFLHENGVLIVYDDDTMLSDLCILDPLWLHAVLRAFLAASPPRSASSATLAGAGASTPPPPSAIVSTSDLFAHLKQNLSQRRIKLHKSSHLRGCLPALLGRCETALRCSSNSMLIAPLLPDECKLCERHFCLPIHERSDIHFAFFVRFFSRATLRPCCSPLARSSAEQRTIVFARARNFDHKNYAKISNKFFRQIISVLITLAPK